MTSMSDTFVGADVEASAPVKSVVVLTTTCRARSSAAFAAYNRRLQAGVLAAYAQMDAETPSKSVKPAKEWEMFQCRACPRKSYRRIGVEAHIFLCKPCRK